MHHIGTKDYHGVNPKYYTGIGSRKTPKNILQIMYDLAAWLAKGSWILRSGGASGADTAFENGTKDGGGEADIYYAEDGIRVDALALAAQHHPAWNRCSDYAKRFHARNCFQVLGDDLRTPAKFVCCWTPDGATGITSQVTGGTGQAIRLAYANHIQIFNLALPDHLSRIQTTIYRHIPE